MITGRKSAHAVAPHDEINSSRGWLAIPLVAIVVTALALVLHFAPAAEADIGDFESPNLPRPRAASSSDGRSPRRPRYIHIKSTF